MPENHLFEYAVIRVVPRVEREEFMNVGVILYCKNQRFLGIKFTVNEARLTGFCNEIDLETLTANLNALTQICLGSKAGGPIATLDAASRFRWITATRSTVVQASKVHPGLCADAAETLQKLYLQLAS